MNEVKNRHWEKNDSQVEISRADAGAIHQNRRRWPAVWRRIDSANVVRLYRSRHPRRGTRTVHEVGGAISRGRTSSYR